MCRLLWSSPVRWGNVSSGWKWNHCQVYNTQPSIQPSIQPSGECYVYVHLYTVCVSMYSRLAGIMRALMCVQQVRKWSIWQREWCCIITLMYLSLIMHGNYEKRLSLCSYQPLWKIHALQSTVAATRVHVHSHVCNPEYHEKGESRCIYM